MSDQGAAKMNYNLMSTERLRTIYEKGDLTDENRTVIEQILESRKSESVTGNASQKEKSRLVSPLGAVLALICFFMPWMKISCIGDPKYISGADIGGAFWIVFCSAALILLIFIYFDSKNNLNSAKILTVLASLVGLIFIAYKLISFLNGVDTGFGKIKPEDVGFKMQAGGLGTIFGLLLSLFGVINYNSNGDK